MKKLLNSLKLIGPGFAVAATGVGAGDMVAATVAGAKFGIIVLWAVVFGALVKYILNEGIARWQLSSGTTVLEGWINKLPKAVSIYFIIYLVVWSFVVGAALIISCGLAVNAMFPVLSVNVWAAIQSVIGVVLVYFGRYKFFESSMKVFIALMFVTLIYCAVMTIPSWSAIPVSLVYPSIPTGSGKFLLGVIGGVGGSVTLMSYGYWIRENGWTGKEKFKAAKIDLSAAYFFTGLFGIAVMIIGAGVNPELVKGDQIVIEVANKLQSVLGTTGRWLFLLGFWGAVFTSLLGVWQGIPYLFADFMNTYKLKKNSNFKPTEKRTSLYYNIFLLYLAFPPLLLMLFGKPVWIIVIYTITGAFFMPFLAITLFYMNNKKEWVGELKNKLLVNFLLVVSLLIFVYLCFVEISEII